MRSNTTMAQRLTYLGLAVKQDAGTSDKTAVVPAMTANIESEKYGRKEVSLGCLSDSCPPDK
jgi:hypothetical protein